MDTWGDQLIILPILLPLLCGAALMVIDERRHQLKWWISLINTAATLAVVLVLLGLSDSEYWRDGIGVYLAANWVAPFGIALVADRLAILMLLVTATCGLVVLCYSAARWGRVGVHYYSLFQFLLMGLNGAFLTGDIFNLFVFFEVMLAASYGLILHGYNSTRIRAGMHYITINLVCSFFFLVGVALIYAASGTLNMADLAAQVADMSAESQQLLQVGSAILAVAFLAKSAIWPLCFWLPKTYAAACAPVAAMLVLVTKVGIYAILRIWSLVFSEDAGSSAHYGADLLVWSGIVSIAFGLVGLFASQELARMAGFSAIASSGTLLAAIGFSETAMTGAALFYLVSSTLAVGALMLLVELIERIRNPVAAMLALTMEAFAIDDEPTESAGVVIPGALAFLGLAFAGCALVIVGFPPLSGFIAKFTLFHALLNQPDGTSPGVTGWALLVLVVVSGLAGVISFMRFGVRTFWASGTVAKPDLRLGEAAPVLVLLTLCVMLTVQAGPLTRFLDRTAASLQTPERYIERVLSHPAVASRGTTP